MNEIWIDCYNFPEHYEVSNFGNIRNKKNKKLRKLSIINSGYYAVTFSKKMKPRNLLVHRVIYESFYGKIKEKMTINHIDNNKLNNRIENLECVSQSVNNVMIKNGKPRGASKCSNGYGWFSGIRVNGKTIFLGRYDTKELAQDRYKEEFIKIYGFSPW